MKILALILTLSGGQFDIRAEKSFLSFDDCSAYLQFRMKSLDVRRGDVVLACVPQNKVEAIMRMLFGDNA